MRLTKEELKEIKAGSSVGWIVAGIIAGVTFIIGVFDGYARPFKCR